MLSKSFQLSFLFLTICLYSCKQSDKPVDDVQLVESEYSFTLADISDLKNNDVENSSLRPRPEMFKNEELPKTYTSRKVIKDIAGLSYDIIYLPGNIVKFNENDSSYVLVTLKSILKDSKLPDIVSMKDEVLYSNIINNKANFNATALIGGLSVSTDQLMELVIQDVSRSIATDTLIDTERIKLLIAKIPEDKRNRYFFIKSSLLTFVSYKKYSKADFSLKVNASFITADGKVYSSKDKFTKERIVSLDLVSFGDILEQNTQIL